MAKYYGKIGIASTSETKPGVWTTTIRDISVYGDIILDTRRSVKTENLNNNIELNVQISIVANADVMANFHQIKYCEYLGVKWNVTSVLPSHPRLILTLGGVYGEE